MVAAELVPWIDMIGYFGGGVTLWGMYSRTMIPLRWGAVGGNLGFLVFGLLAHSYPTLILHAVLLPLNVVRALQMIKLVREIKAASDGANDLDPLIPYMKKLKLAAGAELFRKDDAPDRMLLIKQGTVLLVELDVRCGANDILGEIGAFTPDNRRTCTAVCETDCELYSLSYEAMMQLYYQNPRFGMFLIRVIVQRLLANWQDAEARAKAIV